MVRELTSELQQFEGLATDFDQFEVLAWRLDSRRSAPLAEGVGTPRQRVEGALIWGRTGSQDKPTGWALVQGFRHPDDDEIWHRSIFVTDSSSRPSYPKPGEDFHGTWHAYQRYDHAPTAPEICDFAAVTFLDAEPHATYQRVSGAMRRDAWIRVAGEGPSCGFALAD